MAEQNIWQAYYDWQVTTLWLAHDLASPLGDADEDAKAARDLAVRQEVSEMTLAVLPEEYRKDPNRHWPAELKQDITKVTLMRAAAIAGVIES